MVRIDFPYDHFPFLEVPDNNLVGVFSLPKPFIEKPEGVILREAMAHPTGSGTLTEMTRGLKKILIVSDDHHRPTPINRILPVILEELHHAGFKNDQIEIMMALGSHRPMTPKELRAKLGDKVIDNYCVWNHDWKNPDQLYFAGRVDPGIDVWVNRKIKEFDFVLGLGRIMPIDVCGFTGGGKIIVPGICGEKTNGDFHWVRAHLPREEIIGRRDNPIRHVIDNCALAAGLDAIFNVIMDGEGKIAHAVFGHTIQAHRVGAEHAIKAHKVEIPYKSDIVIANGYPFDIEFWQVNKALDNASAVIRDGGVIIMVSPCYEGLSKTHEREIMQFGYRSSREVKQLVAEGKIRHLVVAVHMIQVAEATIDRSIKCILVTDGIEPEKIKRVNLDYAEQPQVALEKALAQLGQEAKITVLHGAAEMLPIIKEKAGN